MAELPIIPQIDESKPAPDVTVNNLSSIYSFGAFELHCAQADAINGFTLTLTLEDENGLFPTGTLMIARAWFIDAALLPTSTNPENALSIMADPPAVPGVGFLNILFIDGEATLVVTDPTAKTVVLAVEMNSFITLIEINQLGNT